MSNLEWRDENFPVSTRFDDPYYSVVDGRAETDHVFIKGNQLDQRLPVMKHVTIAELGFGTGLNFLETVRQFHLLADSDATMEFISFEQYPMTAEEMKKALSRWETLHTEAEKLLQNWSPEKASEKSKVDFDFSDRIKITVHIADANEQLSNLTFKADAWYLDGFSPAKNPQLWNEALMEEVGRHTASDGTFATYTAAGFVRRGLQAAGFEVEKTRGFGRKRDMLIGKLFK